MATNLVDLEGPVKQWAQTMFDKTKTNKQKSIPKDCLEFQIDWKGVKATHCQPTFEEIILKSLPDAQVLYRASFANNTNQDQMHSFRTERVSRSTCDVIVEKGVTKGLEIGVQLKLPFDVLEANAGFKREVTLTRAEGETVEKEMTWSADTNVTVPPGHKTTAELQVEEKQYDSSFTIVSKAWGKVHVAVLDRRNNTFVKSIDGDLSAILENARPKGVKVDTEHSCIHFKTQGQCSFRYAVQQHVELNQKRLSESY